MGIVFLKMSFFFSHSIETLCSFLSDTELTVSEPAFTLLIRDQALNFQFRRSHLRRWAACYKKECVWVSCRAAASYTEWGHKEKNRYRIVMHLYIYILYIYKIFPGGSDGKASDYNAGDPGSIPASGRSSGEGNGNLLQYSCLENPMDGGSL